MANTQFPIDAVITWVDGNDERHKAKRMKYGNTAMFQAEDIAGNTRYASVGEIFYCIASLNKFAPWLNKIYIVTDEQDPKVTEFIKKHFPQRQIPIEIVDHKTIFKGYEEYLPTFNSIAIESMTWRIPGLSEHYIEFNDDFFLSAPTVPEDFFTPDNRVVCYGKRGCLFLVRMTRIIKRRKNGEKKVTFKELMLNAASQLGNKFLFIKIYHTPRALLKSVYEKFFAEHQEELIKNISYRFRHYKQYIPQEIQALQLYNEGRCILREAHGNLLYLKPKESTGYIRKKLELFTSLPKFKFCCINSLDQASEGIQKSVTAWIEQRLGLKK